ncbi:MAG: FAD-dependent oxidoreductase, partial [Cyanobacteria bacterium P01_G01_bin.38]
VPLGEGFYWIGATVEFPPEAGVQSLNELDPKAELLEAVRQGAIAYCPALATADVIKTWVGFRPRPQGQAAPVIQPLAGYSNVTVATGHYRNGVLLAPATALMVKDMILE